MAEDKDYEIIDGQVFFKNNPNQSMSSPIFKDVKFNYSVGSEPPKEGNRITLDVPKGWECPRCHRIYNPNIPSCANCNAKIKDAPTDQAIDLISGD